jgi:hypothetical protein
VDLVRSIEARPTRHMMQPIRTSSVLSQRPRASRRAPPCVVEARLATLTTGTCLLSSCPPDFYHGAQNRCGSIAASSQRDRCGHPVVAVTSSAASPRAITLCVDSPTAMRTKWCAASHGQLETHHSGRSSHWRLPSSCTSCVDVHP